MNASPATFQGAAASAAPAADAPPGALGEAPCSATVRVNWRGHELLLTLRGFEGASTLVRLGRALDWLEGQGATPASGRARPGPERGATLVDVGNGSGSRGQGQAAAAGSSSNAGPVCPTHGRPMKQGKKGGWFCPAKVAEDDGAGRPVYCRQRAER